MINFIYHFIAIHSLIGMSSFVRSSLRVKNTLIVSTLTDPASINILESLSKRSCWNEMIKGSVWQARSTFGSKVYLWMQEKPLLGLDRIDQTFASDIYPNDEPIGDIIFLSRHAAASGIASLTVHPIGIPWQSECSRSGGIPGRCSPPSFRISSLYRALLHQTKLKGIDGKYQVTLEATHHGPHADIPACFVEIGSTEEVWPVKEAGFNFSYTVNNSSRELVDPNVPFFAGELWADILIDHLGLLDSELPLLPLDGVDDDSTSEYLGAQPTIFPDGVVVVSIGGGHYVPKMNDAVRGAQGIQ